MAQQSWTVRARCSAEQEGGLLTFLNDDPTGQYEFEIRSIDIRTVPSYDLVNAPARFLIGDITAVSGGDPIDMVAYVTTATAIPSQVKIVNLPDNVTLAAGSPTYRGMTRFVNSLATPYNNVNQFASMSGARGASNSTIWDSGRFDGNDGIVLAEGEEMAVIPTFDSANASFICQITIEVGANTHTGLFELYPPTGQNAQFAIFNGTGSGVSISVIKIEVWQPGPSTTLTTNLDQPTVRVTRVNDLRAEGEAVTPVSHNGIAQSVPYLTIRQGTLLAPITLSVIGGINPADDLGYPGTNFAAFRRARTFGARLLQHGNGSKSAGTSQLAGEIQSAMQWTDYFTSFGFNFSDDQLQGFVIRSGEGLAIISNNSTPYNAGVIVRAEIIVRKNPTYYSYY